MKDYIYLAGPMEDKTHVEMMQWRRTAQDLLRLTEIIVLNPTRRISFHDQLKGIDSPEPDKEILQEGIKTLNVCRRIFKQDLQDIAKSKVVIADVRRKSGRGTGTSMELMFAHMKNKIIILWSDPEDFVHPFYEAIFTEKHTELSEAVYAAKEYYT
jgi:nucleoside 2-deoxyribosyltransferase